MKLSIRNIILPRGLFIKLSIVILGLIGFQSCTDRLIRRFEIVYTGPCTPVAFEKESSEEIKAIFDYNGNRAYSNNRDVVLYCIDNREPIPCKVYRSGFAECELPSNVSVK